MRYCESCTAPRTPDYLLYLYHTHLRSLPWAQLHPDTQLMEQLFKVGHRDCTVTYTITYTYTYTDSYILTYMRMSPRPSSSHPPPPTLSPPHTPPPTP